MQIYDSHLPDMSRDGSVSISIVAVLSLLGSVGLSSSSQWRMKRFLTYSAISNLGFMLVTLSSFLIDSYLYYVTIYAITTLNLFAILMLMPNTNVAGLLKLNLLS